MANSANHKIQVPTHPGLECHKHEHDKWMEDAREAITACGYERVMQGNMPTEALKYPIHELMEPLPVEHAGHERRNEANERTARENAKHEELRKELTLEARNEIFTAIKISLEKNSSLTKKLITRDTAVNADGEHDPKGQWHDGPMALKLVQQYYDERGDSNSHKHYAKLERRQTDNKLPASATSRQFERKANYYIDRINDNLEIPRGARLMSKYIVGLLPDRYEFDVNRIESDLDRQGMWDDTLYVLGLCTKLVRNATAKEAGNTLDEATFVSLHTDPTESSELLPLPHERDRAALYKPIQSPTDDGKHCNGCVTTGSIPPGGHSPENCFYNINVAPVVPASVWGSTERMKRIKAVRAEKAKAAGTQAMPLTAPSQEKIEAYKKRLADKKKEGAKRKPSEPTAFTFDVSDIIDANDPHWFDNVSAPFVERHEPAAADEAGVSETDSARADAGAHGSNSPSAHRPSATLPAIPPPKDIDKFRSPSVMAMAAPQGQGRSVASSASIAGSRDTDGETHSPSSLSAESIAALRSPNLFRTPVARHIGTPLNLSQAQSAPSRLEPSGMVAANGRPGATPPVNQCHRTQIEDPPFSEPPLPLRLDRLDEALGPVREAPIDAEACPGRSLRFIVASVVVVIAVGLLWFACTAAQAPGAIQQLKHAAATVVGAASTLDLDTWGMAMAGAFGAGWLAANGLLLKVIRALNGAFGVAILAVFLFFLVRKAAGAETHETSAHGGAARLTWGYGVAPPLLPVTTATRATRLGSAYNETCTLTRNETFTLTRAPTTFKSTRSTLLSSLSPPSPRPPSPPTVSPPPSPPESGGDREPDSGIVSREQAMRMACEVGATKVNEYGDADPDLSELTLADTGAGRDMGNRDYQFTKGSLVPYESKSDTAGGVVVTRQRGELERIVPTFAGQPTRLRRPNATLNPTCPYVLISLGRLSIEEGTSLYVPGDGKTGYFEYPSGLRIPLLNRFVIIIPPARFQYRFTRSPSRIAAPSAASQEALSIGDLVKGGFLTCIKMANDSVFVAGVTRGKVASVASTTSTVIHARFKHRSYEQLKLLPKCFDDIPAWWAQVLRDVACDSCLRATQRRQPPSGHLPREEGLWYFDVWHNSTSFIHGGHTAVIGFIHSTTNFPYTIRLKKRSEAPAAFDMLCAFANSIGATVSWCHTDNALELSKSKAMCQRMLERKVRVTTTNDHRSRQNAIVERFWQTASGMTRASAADANGGALDDKFWGYNWDDAVDCCALMPDMEPPHMCPLAKLLKGPVNGSHRRAWGCLVYPATHVTQRDTRSKTTPQSKRCIHLGYAGSRSAAFDQLGYGRTPGDGSATPGYLCYHPDNNQVIRTSDCSFVENSFPGIERSPKGGWTVPEPDFLLRARGETPPVKEAGSFGPIRPAGPQEWSNIAPATFDTGGGGHGETSEEADDAGQDAAIDGHTREDVENLNPLHRVEVTGPGGVESNAPPPPIDGTRSNPTGDAEETAADGEVSEPPAAHNHADGASQEPASEPQVNQSTSGQAEYWDAETKCPETHCKLQRGHDGPHSNHQLENINEAGPPSSRLRSAFADRAAAMCTDRGLKGLEAITEAAFFTSELERMEAHETEAVEALLAVDELSVDAMHSPEYTKARENYAALCLDHARRGTVLPALEPLVVASKDPTRAIRMADVFADELDGSFVHCEHGCLHPDVLALAKAKSSPDIYTERQMRGKEWDEPKMKEVRALEALDAKQDIAADDPRIAGMQVVDIMWTGRAKRNAQLEVTELKARGVLRGDLHSKLYNVTLNERFAPTERDQTGMAAEAVSAMRGQDRTEFDVSSAYLQGNQRKCEQVLARPPPGYRRFDERGVEILWLMNAPLYGQCDAGAIWNRTFNEFCTASKPDGLEFERCHHDPCLYSKRVGPKHKEAVSMSVYVDDGKIYNDPTATARAEREQTRKRLEHRFKLKFKDTNEASTYTVGTNASRPGDHTRMVSGSTYINSMVKRYLTKELEQYPSNWSALPADPRAFMDDYEAADRIRAVPSKQLYDKYNSLVGALQYAQRRRPDVSFHVNVLARCLTFPTDEMYAHAERVLVYLGRSHALGITYSKYAPRNKLEAYADSDWSVKRSTTGSVVMYAGGGIGWCSKRQHCIACSSCEAELMALASCALEVLFFKGILTAMGEEVDEAIDVFTDNKAAYDLCHRHSAGQHTRHVDRKMYKMRELRGSGVVNVLKIDGAKNPADMFTKPLTRQPFEEHRRTVMNTALRVTDKRATFGSRG